MHRTTEIAAWLCHMGTTGVRRPECRSINPAGIQICHARENRRGISERTWAAMKAGRTGCEQDEPMHTMKDGGRERDEERGPDAVGGPRRRRVNTKAPRRFTTPRYHGRCLTYPRLSGTQAIFTAGRVTTTRATSTRDVYRDALRGVIVGRNVVQNCKHIFECRTI